LKPILGWYSPSFMHKEKTSVIFGKMTTTGPQKIELKTEIEIFNK
jgi:hypothetical protein